MGVWCYSGNTLAAWAELLPPQEAIQMLASAQQAYEAALAQESDAAVRHNYHALTSLRRMSVSCTDYLHVQA